MNQPRPIKSPALQSEPAQSQSSIAHAWRALRHRNFQLFFAGQGISVIGTWMTRIATTWLVYHLTHSALLLGVVSFAAQIRHFFSLFGVGVWAERLNRRRLLIATQAAAAVQSLALAALTLAHSITIGEIIALTALQGLINALDTPARQSFLVQMVEDRNDLSNAIAINSSMANGARLIGPAIAGLVIAAFGEGWCFLIDGVSYFAVIASLLAMRMKPQQQHRHIGGIAGGKREKVGGLRARIPAHPHHPASVRAAQPHGLLLRHYSAHLCRLQVLNGGVMNARLAHGSLRHRRAYFSLLARGAQVRCRPHTHGADRIRRARARSDSLRPVPHALALPAADGLCRLWNDAVRGRLQHHHSVSGH